MIYTLDYSGLTEPVTKADVSIYHQSGAGKSLRSKNIIAAVIIIIIFALYLSILGFSLSVGSRIVSVAFVIVPVVFVSLILWTWLRASTQKRVKFYKFATMNNLEHINEVSNPNYAGMIFDNGHSRQINDAFRFKDGTEIGNFTYATGSGKSQTSHYWGYVRIKLVRRLPHMVLDAKGNNFWKMSNLSDSLHRSQLLRLEGDFNNHFTLYVPKEYERDALYVLTPDVMVAMIEHGKHFDIEIVDDELYIYSNQHFNLDTPEPYSRILPIIATLRQELLDQTDYYADERVNDRAANIISPQGKRLRSSGSWIAVAIVVVVGYICIMQLVQLLQFNR